MSPSCQHVLAMSAGIRHDRPRRGAAKHDGGRCHEPGPTGHHGSVRARPGIDPTWRRTTAGARQRAHAVPRAGPDPVAGREHRAPVVLHELRPARARSSASASVSWWPARAGRSCRWTPLLLALVVVCARVFPVSVDRSGRDLIFFTALHTTRATGLVGPPAGLPAGRRRSWPVRPRSSAAASPSSPPLTAYRWDLIGSPAGDRAVHGAVVPVGTVRRVGRHRRGRRSWSWSWPLPGARRAGRGVIVGALLLETIAPGVSWSPYYKITRPRGRRTYGTRVSISVNGVPHQTMVTGRRGSSTTASQDLRGAVRAPRASPAARRPGRRGRLRLGRRDRAAARAPSTSTPSTSTRDRCRSACSATRTTPTRTRGSPGTSTTAARSWRTPTTKYDLILFALPDSLALVSGASQIRLESLPVHRGGAHGGPRPPHRRRRASRCTTTTARPGWSTGSAAPRRRRSATTRASTPSAGHRGRGRGARPGQPAVRRRRTMRCPRRPLAPATDNAPFLYYHGGDAPGDLPLDAAAGSSCSRCSLVAGRRRTVPEDAPVRRPVLHGRGLPAARDQERRHVREPVRHHLDRQRHGLRRGAAGRARGGRDHATVPHTAAARDVRPDRRRRSRWPGSSRRPGCSGSRSCPGCSRPSLLAFLPIYLANIAFAKRFAEATTTPRRRSG